MKETAVKVFPMQKARITTGILIPTKEASFNVFKIIDNLKRQSHEKVSKMKVLRDDRFSVNL
jgi:hypothetical protein